MANGGDGHVKKRRCVAASDRKRVSSACNACRRLKERCDGQSPCQRCLKHGRTCERPRIEHPVDPVTPTAEQTERESLLETIVRHFMPSAKLDISSLRDVVVDLSSDTLRSTQFPTDGGRLDISAHGDPAGGHCEVSTVRSMEISAKGFTTHLHEQLRDRVRGHEAEISMIGPDNELDADVLLGSMFRFDRRDVPPREVANFLAANYFELAQTVTPFVDKQWIDTKLERLYDNAEALSVSDAPWLCSFLVILAIGTQFCELEDQPQIAAERKEAVALELYDKAVMLLPAVLQLATIDSAQATLLLGHFALTHHHALAITYLEISVGIAGRDGSRKMSASRFDLQGERNRLSCLFEVSTTWVRYLCIANGTSDATHTGHVRSTTTESSTNWSIMRVLTNWFEKIVHSCGLYLGDAALETGAPLQDILKVRKEYKQWWATIPSNDMPYLQLNRRQCHLHLHHNLNILSLGRPFIFSSMRAVGDTGHVADPRIVTSPLVADAEFAAYNIIDICSTLKQSSSLSKASYIEARACHEAVVVMLAQSLGNRCQVFRNKLGLGMEMLRGVASVEQFARLEALDDVIQQITGSNPNDRAGDSSTSKYTLFRSWVMGMKNTKVTSTTVYSPSVKNSDPLPLDVIDWDLFEIGEIPELSWNIEYAAS